MKKIIFLSTTIFFLFAYYGAFASLQINEIMYDLENGSDDGREWIEIYNDSESVVDLSSFRLFEANTNHKIKLVQGGVNISAKGYAIIVSDPANFQKDWPNNSFNIFDSSFSLNNDGEVLAIKDKNLKIVDQYLYSNFSGMGDGKSLQKINGMWVGANPTPGVENKVIFIPQPKVQSSKIVLVPTSKVVTESALVEKKAPVPEIMENTAGREKISVPDLPKKEDSYIFAIILIFLIVISSSAVYFIRRRKSISNPGDDFKILEE